MKRSLGFWFLIPGMGLVIFWMSFSRLGLSSREASSEEKKNIRRSTPTAHGYFLAITLLSLPPSLFSFSAACSNGRPSGESDVEITRPLMPLMDPDDVIVLVSIVIVMVMLDDTFPPPPFQMRLDG